MLAAEANDALEMEFPALENVAEELKVRYIKDGQARAAIVKAAEAGRSTAVTSCRPSRNSSNHAMRSLRSRPAGRC